MLTFQVLWKLMMIEVTRMVFEGLISYAYPWKALAGWSYQGMIRECSLKSSDLER